MHSAHIHIKRATPEDAQLISDLSTGTFIETYRGSCTDDDVTEFLNKYFNEKSIGRELNNRNDFYYIVFADGAPAGYMRLMEDYTGYPLREKYKALQLKRIYLLKEYHSQKIGSALMSFALQLAADNAYDLVWLGVWEGNPKAKRFYERWGFTDINQPYSFYVGNTVHTDRWMTKSIEK
jgi:GNAT superfamily N-acetyltransferase